MIIKIYDIDWTDARDRWEEYRGTDTFDLPEVIIFKYTDYDNLKDMLMDYDNDESIKEKLGELTDDFTAFIVNNFDYKETTEEEFQSYWKDYNSGHGAHAGWSINPQPYIEIAE
jgi:hypothetical protein